MNNEFERKEELKRAYEAILLAEVGSEHYDKCVKHFANLVKIELQIHQISQEEFKEFLENEKLRPKSKIRQFVENPALVSAAASLGGMLLIVCAEQFGSLILNSAAMRFVKK